MTRRAVIDIGTNSVKLLVAEVEAGCVRPHIERSVQTRLGQGLYTDRRLDSDAIRRTVDVVAAFARKVGALSCDSLEVVATSAARDARNGDDLAQAVRAATGRLLRILTGIEEAEQGFAGAVAHPRFRGRPVLLFDVGGGSTECALGVDGRIEHRQSCDLGVVRCLEAWRLSDPPTPSQRDTCRAAILDFLSFHLAPGLAPALASIPAATLQCVAVGGTATILAAMELGLRTFDRERIDGLALSRARVEARLDQLWNLPLEARRQIPGLPPERADVILAGVAIFATLLERFALDALAISTRGLRHALALAGPPGVLPNQVR
jgi:exopolyphosphatase/guanosine-5'-triphosphate,3'-diphosphate pyrophosphatase